MKLSLPQHTGIIARTNKFMHNVRFQILGYFEEKKKRKKSQDFGRLKYQAYMCVFAIKLGYFVKCFLGTV